MYIKTTLTLYEKAGSKDQTEIKSKNVVNVLVVEIFSVFKTVDRTWQILQEGIFRQKGVGDFQRS